MKAKDVMRILNISRSSLYNYTKSGTLTGSKLDNGYYDYDESSVMAIMKKDARGSVIYARVSTHKQKSALSDQVALLQAYCKEHEVDVANVYSEIASGVDLDRTEFSKLLDDIIQMKIKTVYITHKDRLTRLSFKTIESLFSKFNVNIVVIGESQYDDNELFGELMSLIHVFSTKVYSNRRKDKLKLVNSDIENFLTPEV